MIKRLLKRIIYGGFLLYGYNCIAVSYNMMIPFNYFNLIGISCLGVPGMVGLVLFKYLVLWGFYYGII